MKRFMATTVIVYFIMAAMPPVAYCVMLADNESEFRLPTGLKVILLKKAY